jgi:hypothetical protein
LRLIGFEVSIMYDGEQDKRDREGKREGREGRGDCWGKLA